MILAFKWQVIIRFILVIGFATLAALSVMGWPDTLFRRMSFSIALTVGFFVVFGGNRGLWRWAWNVFPRLNHWVYPDLNGTWRGTLSSNWPVIERMAKAANGDITTFNPFLSPELAKRQTVPLTLRICAGWFRIHVRMETDDRYSKSRTINVTPVRCSGGDPHAISYIFENSTPDAVATDTSQHRGAAWLEISLAGADPILEGNVWTDRNWQKGLNTAGLLSVRRISRDPEATETDTNIV